jgi:hypothetical protein
MKIKDFIKNEMYDFNHVEIYGFFDILVRYKIKNNLEHLYDDLLELNIDNIFNNSLKEDFLLLYENSKFETEDKWKIKYYFRYFKIEKSNKKTDKISNKLDEIIEKGLLQKNVTPFSAKDRKFNYDSQYESKNKVKNYCNLFSNITEYKFYNNYVYPTKTGFKKEVNSFFPIFKNLKNYYSFLILMYQVNIENGNNFKRNFNQFLRVKIEKLDLSKKEEYKYKDLYEFNGILDSYNLYLKIGFLKDFCTNDLKEELINSKWYKSTYHTIDWDNKESFINIIELNGNLNEYFLNDFNNELIKSINGLITPLNKEYDLSYYETLKVFINKTNFPTLSDLVNKIYNKEVELKNDLKLIKWFLLKKEKIMTEQNYEMIKNFASKINTTCYFLAKELTENNDSEKIKFKKNIYLKSIKHLLDSSENFPEFIKKLTEFGIKYSEKLKYQTLYPPKNLDELIYNGFMDNHFNEFKIYFPIFLWVGEIIDKKEEIIEEQEILFN